MAYVCLRPENASDPDRLKGMKTTATSIKHAIAGAVLLLVNGFSYRVLLPYVQQTANSHVSIAKPVAMLYYLAGVLLITLAVRRQLKRGDRTLLAIRMVTALALALWGYQFWTVYCQKCASMG